MLRCFDCDAAADDARQLLDAGCWSSTKGSGSSGQTAVVTEQRPMSTEYKRTFLDFTGRTRTGPGEPDATVTDAPAPGPGVTRAHTWYSQLQELRRNALCYKVRNWGKESAPEHLVYLYERAEDPQRPPERKIISALYLETLHPEITRGGHDRKSSEDAVDSRGRTAVSAGASQRQKSHPPSAAGRATARDRTGLRLHVNEKRTRPGSAQPVATKTGVDKTKGRSPSAPRPPSVPSSTAIARSKSTKQRRKSPSERPLTEAVDGGVKAGSGPPQAATGGGEAATVAAARSVDVRSPASSRYTPELSAASGPISIDSSYADSVVGLVKSPPMPTRVKSPEDAAALRSPEPVNWTLPLDTARAFAVTQNVPPGAHKSHSSRARSRQSPAPGQISPLHKQLVNDQMARSSQPAVPTRASATSQDNGGEPAPQNDGDLSSALANSSEAGTANSGRDTDGSTSLNSVPDLVRPSQELDRSPEDALTSIGEDSQQSCGGRPPGASLFSGGSAEPPPAAMVALFGSAKPTQAKAEAQGKPVYRVI